MNYGQLSYQEKIDLASNPSTPIEVLEMLLKYENYSISDEKFSLLAKSDDEEVRIGVAVNVTNEETLTLLATDDSEEVRLAVAQNKNTSSKTLALLFADSDSTVRIGVALNENADSTILAKLSNDKNDYVKEAVAQNIKTDSLTLAKLATYENIREIVLNNPNYIDYSDSNMIMEILNSKDTNRKLLLASNETTPSNILNILSKDKDENIQMQVFKNPNYSSALLDLEISEMFDDFVQKKR